MSSGLKDANAAADLFSPAVEQRRQPAPLHDGHRQRLKQRFTDAGEEALPDYELLELVLFNAIPRRDTKPIAKQLLERFNDSFAEVVNAPAERLKEVAGVGDSVVYHLHLVRAAALRLMRVEIKEEREVFSSWDKVVDYCRAKMAFERKEQFLILFLDRKNRLIDEEIQQSGTVDHTPVYPREVVKRALELSASAIILVHNPPHSPYFDHVESRHYPLNNFNFLDCHTSGYHGTLGSVLRGISRPCDPSRRPLLAVWRPHLRADGRAQCRALPMGRYAAL